MRIPSKIEANNLVAQQRKAQIDEGVLIAKKVDVLREKLASLQVQHENYIAGMEQELVRRTQDAISHIAELQRDIKELEERKKQALIPIEADVDALHAAQKELESFRVNLEKKQARLEEREHVQDTRDQKSKELATQVRARDRASIREYNTAEELKIESEKLLLETQDKAKKQTDFFEKQNNELATREQSILSYEFTLKMREEQVVQKEEEIVQEKIRLLDQRQTLERALARIK